MMMFEREVGMAVQSVFSELFGKHLALENLTFQVTRKEFPGDLTLVVFNLSKLAGKSPEDTGKAIGEKLIANGGIIADFNVVKGFLNLEIDNRYWVKAYDADPVQPIQRSGAGKHVMVEYSSPNTNKPLHLGHIRNNLLGFSVAEILKEFGHQVTKVNIVNDRGIHICKSMLAWKLFGEGETPQSSGMKGDHLVGKYYVEFDRNYRNQVAELESKGIAKEVAEKDAPLMVQVRKMLQLWEAGDPETLALWKMMNDWVYEGFDLTYKRLGVDFDKIYYESDTYLLGKEIIEQGLSKGILYQRDDGSVWIDLKAEGLDEKLLLRSDGTSVYMTQDLGTAVKRHEDFGFDRMIYVVGNEQDYHFKVLFLILSKLGYEWAARLYHLSYNMVDLPSGKMKSREGTVVDADDLIDEMHAEAASITKSLGKLDEPDSESSIRLFEQIGLGALKYFLLKVDPEKRMLFDPNESIDFNGNTGPFIQYTHARICSVLNKAMSTGLNPAGITAIEDLQISMNPYEKMLMKQILKYEEVLEDAAIKLSPAVIANYTFELAKIYNQFYHENAIIDLENKSQSLFRIHLSKRCAATLSRSLGLLGIYSPEKM